MPSIHFKDDYIEAKFSNKDSFLSEIEADYDIKMSMKEYPNGTVEGSLKTNDMFINLFPAEKLLRFNISDSSLDVNLTEYQVNELSNFFRNRVYHELDVPEFSSPNYDPPRNNMNNEDPTRININLNSMPNSNNPTTNGGKRSTRRRKTKHNKSKRKIRK